MRRTTLPCTVVGMTVLVGCQELTEYEVVGGPSVSCSRGEVREALTPGELPQSDVGGRSRRGAVGPRDALSA